MLAPHPFKLRPPRLPSNAAAWAGYALLLGALVLYLVTLDNGLRPGELIGGDLITHQYAQVQARPSNAPGYPLYTMGGWLWFHSLRAIAHTFGQGWPNPLPLLSSYSTLWAIVALWLFYRILCYITRTKEQPTGNWLLAWLLCAFYAVTYFFWYYATTTEQYSSAVAQTLGIVYIYLLWADKNGASRSQSGHASAPQPPVFSAAVAAQPAARLLLLLAFLCGLSLAHMLTVAFIVPPVVAVVLWQAPTLLRSPRTIFANGLAALLPLVSYLYVYVRGALHPEWWGEGHWSTATAWFWAFLSTAQGREELSRGFEPGRALWGGGFPVLMAQELSLPLLLLGLLGIARLERKLALMLYSTLAVYGIFCWGYRYGNWFQVILPAYPLILLGVAALINAWQTWSGSFGNKVNISTPYLSLITYYCPLALLLIAIVWRFSASLPQANSHNQPADTALDEAAVLLAQPLPTGARLFATVDDALALQYLIDIWQIHPDRHVISSLDAARWLAQGQPVFATWQAASTLRAELPKSLVTTQQSAGPDWVVFQTNKQDLNPKPASQWERAVTSDITLQGYTVTASPSLAPVKKIGTPGMDIVLFWQLQGDWPDNLSISVRPTWHNAFLPSPAGGIIQEDTARPAHALLALADWPHQQAVADAYRLPLPKALPAGADGVRVILYRSKAGGFENVAELSLPLPAFDADTSQVSP